MTKLELIISLEDLPDDTVIYVPSIEVAGDEIPASHIQISDGGRDEGPLEVTILGGEEW